MCDVFSKESKEEVSSTLRKDKSLPKWISSVAQVGHAIMARLS